MKETGRVVKADPLNCRIEFIRTSACESCGACTKFGEKSMSADLPNTLHAKEGDVVVVEMSARNVIGASMWAYIFPLLMLLIGAYTGKLLMSVFTIQGEWFIALVALAFAGLSYFILRLLNPYFANRKGFRPAMVEIIRDDVTQS